MIARRVREWPRATVAVALLAVGLVLIGVLLASTGSGGSARAASAPSKVSHTPAAGSAAPGALNAERATKAPAPGLADKAQIIRLQKSLTQESGQLAAARSALAASQADVSCWQGKARHPRKERAVKCGTGSGT